MQGDTVTVLVDRGEGKVVDHVVRATSPGGSVVVDGEGGDWDIQERSRGGTIRARVRVPYARLISIVEEPAKR